jgi:hypothetical protein
MYMDVESRNKQAFAIRIPPEKQQEVNRKLQEILRRPQRSFDDVRQNYDLARDIVMRTLKPCFGMNALPCWMTRGG